MNELKETNKLALAPQDVGPTNGHHEPAPFDKEAMMAVYRENLTVLNQSVEEKKAEYFVALGKRDALAELIEYHEGKGSDG